MSLIDVRSKWLRISKLEGGAAAEHIVIAATFTANPIVPYLGVAYAETAQSPPLISTADYNQLFQVCLGWETMFPIAPTAIVLMWRIEDFLRAELQAHIRGDAAALPRAEAKLGELMSAVEALRKSFPGVIVISTPPYPHSSDHHMRAMRSTQDVGRFHRRMVDLLLTRVAEIKNVSVLDVDGVARHVGLDKSIDHRKWYLYRQPYTEAFYNELALDLAAIVRQQKSASKKCIVVDCDNTLWGGIIGEDGLEGIALSEDFPGSAFRDFQHQLLNLRSQGVMIALCSKNNEADVWEVFERHDGMVLKREHVVAHRINWQDKPSNIEAIAKELNIGLDSFVFVDDSPLEINHVREALPMVTTIQVPGDVALFPATISMFRLFDREEVSDEDRSRSDMMLQEKTRQTFADAVSPEEFRKSLDLVVELFEVQPEHVARVTQLFNKTNQFNLTTLRKTSADIAALCADPKSQILALRVADRFGEYGLVGVLVLNYRNDVAEIESFLMSCRVLGRGVEESIFAALADQARARGATKLRGTYIPTKKNGMVADLYARYGFENAGDNMWEAVDLGRFVWPDYVKRAGL